MGPAAVPTRSSSAFSRMTAAAQERQAAHGGPSGDSAASNPTALPQPAGCSTQGLGAAAGLPASSFSMKNSLMRVVSRFSSSMKERSASVSAPWATGREESRGPGKGGFGHLPAPHGPKFGAMCWHTLLPCHVHSLIKLNVASIGCPFIGSCLHYSTPWACRWPHPNREAQTAWHLRRQHTATAGLFIATCSVSVL